MDFQMPDLSWLFDPDNVTSVARAIGIVLPVIMTVITKVHAPKKVKAAVLAALTGVVAFIAPILVGVGIPTDLRELVNGALNAAVVAVLVQIGILKPTGISDLIAEKTANFGFGGEPPVDEPVEESPAESEVQTPVEEPANDPAPAQEPDVEPAVDEPSTRANMDPADPDSAITEDSAGVGDVPVDNSGSLVEIEPDSDQPVEDVVPSDLHPDPADETDPTDAELAELDEMSSGE